MKMAVLYIASYLGEKSSMKTVCLFMQIESSFFSQGDGGGLNGEEKTDN